MESDSRQRNGGTLLRNGKESHSQGLARRCVAMALHSRRGAELQRQSMESDSRKRHSKEWRGTEKAQHNIECQGTEKDKRGFEGDEKQRKGVAMMS